MIPRLSLEALNIFLPGFIDQDLAVWEHVLTVKYENPVLVELHHFRSEID
jgi:hypothetical protein